MSNDRIRGFLLPSEEVVPAPINSLIFVESESGNRVHVCASRRHVRELLAACPDTPDERATELHENLSRSRLPESSARDPIVIGGWAGGFLVELLDGDQMIGEDTLEMFTHEVASLFHLVLPDEDEEGDQAILMALDERVHFDVWVLSSRSDVLTHLAMVRHLAEPGDYVETLAWFADCPKIAEHDPSRPPVQIEGFAAALITTFNFCLDEQRRNAS